MKSGRRGLLVGGVVVLALAGLADLLLVDLVAAPRFLEERAAEARPGPGPVAIVAFVAPGAPAGEPAEPPPPVVPPPPEPAPAPAPPTPEAAPPPEVAPPPAPPAPPPEVAPPPEPAAEPEALGPRPPQVEDVLFGPESSALSRRGRRALWTVVWIMRRHPELRVLVRGHADPTGSAAGNARLSQERADAAARFLTEHGHLDPARVDVEAVGSREPMAEGATRRALARSRRVELLWR